MFYTGIVATVFTPFVIAIHLSHTRFVSKKVSILETKFSSREIFVSTYEIFVSSYETAVSSYEISISSFETEISQDLADLRSA